MFVRILLYNDITDYDEICERLIYFNCLGTGEPMVTVVHEKMKNGKIQADRRQAMTLEEYNKK